jgi:hypothetical protein
MVNTKWTPKAFPSEIKWCDGRFEIFLPIMFLKSVHVYRGLESPPPSPRRLKDRKGDKKVSEPSPLRPGKNSSPKEEDGGGDEVGYSQRALYF